MLLTLIMNLKMAAGVPVFRPGGYVRPVFTEVVDKKKEQAKREDEILLMVIKGFVENL